jgi:uncharacterized membrane protein YphA (DoxX/SURF4 family)
MFVHVTIHPLPNPPIGQVQLFDAPGENIIFETLAQKSGYIQFEPAGRVLTSLIELFAAFLLLLPFSRRFGAVIAFLVMTTAVGLHLSPWLGREVPLTLGGSETDGGMLFSLAIAMLVASLLLLIVHPGKRVE